MYNTCDEVNELVDGIEKAMAETPNENLKGEIKPLWDSLVRKIEHLTSFVEKI